MSATADPSPLMLARLREIPAELTQMPASFSPQERSTAALKARALIVVEYRREGRAGAWWARRTERAADFLNLEPAT